MREPRTPGRASILQHKPKPRRHGAQAKIRKPLYQAKGCRYLVWTGDSEVSVRIITARFFRGLQ